MANAKISELTTRTPDGTEFIEVIIPPFNAGTNRKVLLQDALDLASGGSGTVETIVAGANISVDDTDPANPIVSASGVLETIVAGTNITVDDTDPANPIISSSGGGSGTVETIVAGTNITVDDTDPANPIVSATGSDLVLVVPSTAGGTVTLDFDSDIEKIFVGSASFATPKTIAFSNDTNALIFTLTLTITNVAGVVTFPATVSMNTQDSRWNTSLQAWAVQAGAEGRYVFGGGWDGTNWNVVVQGPLG